MFDAQHIPINKLIVPERRPYNKEAHNALLESIKERGIVQPIVVEPKGYKYLIWDGVERYRVCVELGMKSIPALVKGE